MSHRRPDDLAAAGLVASERLPALKAVAARYSVAVTDTVAGLIENPDDPIGRQYLPHEDELSSAPGEVADPTGDDAFSPLPGIVHRYPDRVLLKPHHACAVYCRFCFRRERVGPGGDALGEAALEAALDYIRARPSVWEVILTGGDPLLMSPRRLRALLAALDAIPHLGALRLHTRLPLVDPARVGDELVASLATEKALWLALHVNHPRELTDAVRTACARLARAGLPLLSQTVLLRGVNDDAATLDALFRALVALRIKPYYLHHLDAAPGTARFRVPLAEGQELVRALRGRLSGVCQPTYVLDIPGGHGKVPVGPSFLDRDGVRDPWGRKHLFNAEVENCPACATSAPASPGPTTAATGAIPSRP
jgi:lysine 2,3-aminomutase